MFSNYIILRPGSLEHPAMSCKQSITLLPTQVRKCQNQDSKADKLWNNIIITTEQVISSILKVKRMFCSKTHFSRPKKKALSLILWLVNFEHFLTTETRLCSIRVDGPEKKKKKSTFINKYKCSKHKHMVCDAL